VFGAKPTESGGLVTHNNMAMMHITTMLPHRDIYVIYAGYDRLACAAVFAVFALDVAKPARAHEVAVL
jgi:hypothetical protein